GSSVTFTATPTNGGAAPTYQWSVNKVIIVGATGPTFTSNTLNNNDEVQVVMTSNSACATTNTATSTPVVITVATNITPTFDAIGPLCQSSFAPVLPATSKEGVTGTWSPSAISTATIGSTVYTFTPTNNPCAIPVPLTIVVNQAASSTTDTTICFNQLPFTWSGNTYPAAGTYQVSFSSASGCDSVATLILRVNPASIGQRYDTVVTSPNTPTQLQARSIGNNSAYDWEPPTGLSFSNIYNPVFNYDQNEDYIITISTGTGCIVHYTLTVLVNSSSNITSAVYVPLAWSPNGDGNNDKLTPLTVNIKTLNYFRVFNRWGQLMFETSTIGAGWDGMYNGKPQVADAYTWTLEAVGNDGKTYKQSGTALLLR
ncbi:MAG: gliding motility-associated C-terminal domain-containing protein, partial [Bacteroidetes bacterium]|nr:gliding motility-associated C-terminal domain-containing protein [Bacteroidota bacterium]